MDLFLLYLLLLQLLLLLLLLDELADPLLTKRLALPCPLTKLT
jgi:hypothetical protein